MKATVIATQEQLSSIGIPPFDGIQEEDFRTGVEVEIINKNLFDHPVLGVIAEVKYLHEILYYSLPLKWLKLNEDASN